MQSFEGPRSASTAESSGFPSESLDETLAQRTTSGHIAIRNLSAQIESLSQRRERFGDSLAVAVQLGDLLLSRAQFIGSYDDLAAANILADEWLALEPESPRVNGFAARARASVHEFSRARDHLSVAARGVQTPASENSQATLLEVASAGDLEKARRDAARIAGGEPTFKNLSALAAVTAAQGQFALADELYQRALSTIRDVSPFPVAWVYFQRGVMWAEQANEPERALALYAEATRRLPQYVTATVHLAELESRFGRTEKARQRLELLLEGVPEALDPEPLGLLASLREGSQPEAFQSLVTEADERYQRLLSRFPFAFLDHASEFYAGPGARPQHAVELAVRNLKLRRNSRAYLVALRAAAAAADLELFCDLHSDAQSMALPSRNLAAFLREHPCQQPSSAR